MKSSQPMKPQAKDELTPLQQADCKTGRMPGGIVFKKPSSGKRRRIQFDDRDCFYHINKSCQANNS